MAHTHDIPTLQSIVGDMRSQAQQMAVMRGGSFADDLVASEPFETRELLRAQLSDTEIRRVDILTIPATLEQDQSERMVRQTMAVQLTILDRAGVEAEPLMVRIKPGGIATYAYIVAPETDA